MPRITATVSDEQYQHLEQRAEELDRSMAEVTRLLVDADMDSDVLHSDAPRNDVTDSDVQQLVDRLEELEQRVSELEDQPEPADPIPNGSPTVTDRPSPDELADTDDSLNEVVEWVREYQPVERKEIVAAFEDLIEERGIKSDSWWRKHCRPELKDAGFEHVREEGWQLE